MTGEHIRRGDTPAGSQGRVTGEDGVHDANRDPHVPTDETPEEREKRQEEAEKARKDDEEQ